MLAHLVRSGIRLSVTALLIASGQSAADEGARALPPIEAGQTWRYLLPPPEYGSVAMIQSVSGESALVAVHDLLVGESGVPSFQLVRIHVQSLQLSLDGPGESMERMPSAAEKTPYSCGAQPLAQCLHAIHSLRSLKAEDLYDR